MNNSQRVTIKQGKKKINISGIKTIQGQNETYNSDSVNQKFDGDKDVLMIKESKNAVYTHEETIEKKAQREASRFSNRKTIDPYAVKINNQKYYLVKNKQNGNYTINDILGYEDSKSELFKELKELDKNNDKKITKIELKKADIRFIAVKNNKLLLNDKSQDYNLENILYIDLNTLRGTINNGEIGSFGYFDVYIKNNNQTQKIIGFVTFDSDEVLRELISQ